jgi:hypothetical protein
VETYPRQSRGEREAAEMSDERMRIKAMKIETLAAWMHKATSDFVIAKEGKDPRDCKEFSDLADRHKNRYRHMAGLILAEKHPR